MPLQVRCGVLEGRLNAVLASDSRFRLPSLNYSCRKMYADGFSGKMMEHFADHIENAIEFGRAAGAVGALSSETTYFRQRSCTRRLGDDSTRRIFRI